MLEEMKFVLNPFFRLNLKKPLSCDLFLSGKVVELPSVRYVPLLARLDGAHSLEVAAQKAADVLAVPTDEGKRVIQDLIAAELLVAETREFPEIPGVRHWMARGWLEALMLHLRTRNLEFADDVPDPRSVLEKANVEALKEEKLPSIWKAYPNAELIELPPPSRLPDESLTAVLLRRRSHQPWRAESMSLEQLSTILHYASLRTVRCRLETEEKLETDPTVLQLSSSFCAIETYFAAFSIDGLAPGIYFYDPKGHRITQLRPGLFRTEIAKAALGQNRASSGSCTFFFTAVWERYMFRYRHSRAFHRLMISVSELAQKYLVLATALNMNTFLTPNLHYADSDELLGTNSYEEGTLYAVAVG